jgi:hypothetical protein
MRATSVGFAVLGAALAASGCFHPNIKDGELGCSDDGKCPGGMVCMVGFCYNIATVGQFDFSQVADGGGGVYGTGALGLLDLAGSMGTIELNTETGEILFMGNAGAKTLVTAQAAAGAFPQVQPTSGGPPVAIWSFTDVNIPAGVTLTAKGSNVSVPVIASTGKLTLAGKVDLVGFGGLGGRAGMAGSANGMTAQQGSGTGGGSDGSGGGGGGYGSAGKPGMGANTGKGGLAFGTTTILPVAFGAGGGGGGGIPPNAIAGLGGNGGGAIVLLAHQIEIAGTVDVSGASGKPANPGSSMPAGGGGGGSGGSILVSGDMITMMSGSMLLATGGKGGMGATGGFVGGDGGDGRIWVGSATAVNGVLAGSPAAVSGAALTMFPR